MSFPAASASGSKQRELWLALWLIAATLLTYQPAWRGEAVFDDSDHLTPPELQSVAGLGRIWTELGVVSQYYPVTHTAFWLQHRAWGDAMPGYHAVNLLLHAGAALWLVVVMRRLELPGAWLGGALFALHPVHVESVAWISELKNTLSTFCGLAAVATYLKFERTREARTYGLALGWFVLALGAKTVAATLAPALLVLAWWRRGRITWRDDVRPVLPFLGLALGCGWLTAWVERRFIGAEGADFSLGLVERGLVAGRALWFYAGNVVWPVDLAFIYPRWNVNAADWTAWLGSAAAVAALVAAWLVRQRSRAPLAALLLFAGLLFPALGFVNVYPFVYSFVADHYQYLADATAVAVIAAAATWAAPRLGLRAPAVRAAATLVLLGLLAFGSWAESRKFADAETLWRETLARNPDAFVAHSNLANCLFERGRTEEALAHARRALALKPGFAELHNNLGHFLFELGRTDEALAEFRAAVARRPELAAAQFSLGAALLRAGGGAAVAEAEECFQRAIAARPDFVRARTVLAGLWIDRGQVDGALAQLEAALQVRPNDAEALFAVGNARLAQGRVPEAIGALRRAVAADSSNVGAAHNLGVALWRGGERRDAESMFRRAVVLQPQFLPSWSQLGELLIEDDRAPEAVEVLRRAVALAPAEAAALNSLGVALMRTGATGEATECFRRALHAAPDFAVAKNNLALALQLSSSSVAPAPAASPQP